MAASQNILILSSNTGGGHRSAANALRDSMLALPGQVSITIEDVLEHCNGLTRQMAGLYNFLLRDYQHWMKYYYWMLERLKPNESMLMFKAALGYGKNVLRRACPDVIVSVHPMTHHFFAYALRKLGLRDQIPIVTVVTDPCAGFWRAWACEDVSRYHVASLEAKQQLIDYGVGSHKIHVSGMPVHSRFHPVEMARRRALRTEHGLDPDKFTLFINAGWAGGGNIPQIFESLAMQANQGADLTDLQVVFLGGRNPQTIQMASEIAMGTPFPVSVRGYTRKIEELMQLSDIMLTKCGGLTTFEALSCQLPILADSVTEPMPQEARTVEYIQNKGLGVRLGTAQAIVPVLQNLMWTPDSLHTMRLNTETYARAGASDRIAAAVMDHLDTPPASPRLITPAVSGVQC
ncbi:MAG: hypothetical protein AB7P76_04245 [Candidatus Melainabacteria bacterium]